MKCSRCHRSILHPVYVGGVAMGSTCARAVSGARVRRPRLFDRNLRRPDERQVKLFES